MKLNVTELYFTWALTSASGELPPAGFDLLPLGDFVFSGSLRPTLVVRYGLWSSVLQNTILLEYRVFSRMVKLEWGHMGRPSANRTGTFLRREEDIQREDRQRSWASISLEESSEQQALRTSRAQTFSFSLCVCMCVHVCRCAPLHVCLGRGQRLTLSVLLHCSPTLFYYHIEFFSLNLGLAVSGRQSRQHNPNILPSLLSRTGVTGICSHACIFLYHVWNKNQDLHACEAGLLSTEPFPQLPSSSF